MKRTLYILFAQICLHAFGPRRKSTIHRILINLNVWLLYLLADLLATIALGKLSNVKVRSKKPETLLPGLWAPIILFYLGGPDTITVLALDESFMWLRHLIGLVTQGFRTAYVLYATWTSSWLSILALLMLIPGVIKYGERVWVIRSRVRAISEGSTVLDESTIISLDQVNTSNAPASSKLVLQAYSCFQTLKPHIPGYYAVSDRSRVDNLIRERTVKDSFKLIEIELGFMYDIIFSKAGIIFTVWGYIFRFISLSCLVCVLVGFILVEKPTGRHLKADLPITIVLMLGAIFLEIAGVLVQLISDWAEVWAWKYPSKLATLVFWLHRINVVKSQRWSKLTGSSVC